MRGEKYFKLRILKFYNTKLHEYPQYFHLGVVGMVWKIIVNRL
jgi:hypothetical protein